MSPIEPTYLFILFYLRQCFTGWPGTQAPTCLVLRQGFVQLRLASNLHSLVKGFLISSLKSLPPILNTGSIFLHSEPLESCFLSSKDSTPIPKPLASSKENPARASSQTIPNWSCTCSGGPLAKLAVHLLSSLQAIQCLGDFMVPPTSPPPPENLQPGILESSYSKQQLYLRLFLQDFVLPL